MFSELQSLHPPTHHDVIIKESLCFLAGIDIQDSYSIGAMDTGAETNINGGVFSTEQGQNHENGVTSAHTIDHGMFIHYIQKMQFYIVFLLSLLNFHCI